MRVSCICLCVVSCVCVSYVCVCVFIMHHEFVMLPRLLGRPSKVGIRPMCVHDVGKPVMLFYAVMYERTSMHEEQCGSHLHQPVRGRDLRCVRMCGGGGGGGDGG